MTFWKGLGRIKRMIFLFNIILVNSLTVFGFYFYNKDFFDLLFSEYKIGSEMFMLNIEEPLLYLLLFLFLSNVVLFTYYIKKYSMKIKNDLEKQRNLKEWK